MRKDSLTRIYKNFAGKHIKKLTKLMFDPKMLLKSTILGALALTSSRCFVDTAVMAENGTF